MISTLANLLQAVADERAGVTQALGSTGLSCPSCCCRHRRVRLEAMQRAAERELVGDDIDDHAQIVRETIAGIGRRQISRLA